MGLERYFKRVMKWWWLILISPIIAATASYLVSSRQPHIYQTSATIMVGRVIEKVNPSYEDFAMSGELARSYSQIVHQQPVLQGIVDSLDLDMDWRALSGQVYAYPVEGTQLLVITAADTSPERAKAIADEAAYQLTLQSPTSPENQARRERSEFVHSQLDDLEGRIQAAQVRIVELRTKLDTAFSAREIQDIQTEITNLEGLVNTWQANYSELLKFLEGGNQTNLLTIIEPAALPSDPISPNVKMNVALAAAAALLLTIGAALMLEYFDDTIRSTDDLGGSLRLTVLGVVNQMKGTDYRDKVVSSHSPFSPVVEAYRLMRANIQFLTAGQATKFFMITSPNPGEGKSVTTANLGIMMAQADFKTIIVDADLRKPAMHKIFQLSNSDGLADLLHSNELEPGSWLKNTGIENLQVITSGSLPSNSTELLGSQRMARVLERLAKLADVILLDSSPILAVTDAVVLASRVDGVVLVVEAGQTRRQSIQQALDRLRRAGANVLGSVLNRVSGKDAAYAYYAHYTRSGREAVIQSDNSTPRRWWQRLPVLKRRPVLK